MPRGVLAAAFVVASASGAFAQGAPPDASFKDTQREGLRLFSQSCGVCHTVVQQRTRQYGPVLSRETLGGDQGCSTLFVVVHIAQEFEAAERGGVAILGDGIGL